MLLSGNVIIYTPQGQNSGTGIWYGRVSPHEVPAVVKHTIMEGKVLPEILRGGINMSREQGHSLDLNHRRPLVGHFPPLDW
jgi:(2Fe-2S) ferredoxin